MEDFTLLLTSRCKHNGRNMLGECTALVFHLVSAKVSARHVYCRGLGPNHLLSFSSTPRFDVKSLNVSANSRSETGL